MQLPKWNLAKIGKFSCMIFIRNKKGLQIFYSNKTVFFLIITQNAHSTCIEQTQKKWNPFVYSPARSLRSETKDLLVEIQKF
jgi:hypothetical protein